jgi:uncharacterized membrane protein (UPF0127 family)
MVSRRIMSAIMVALVGILAVSVLVAGGIISIPASILAPSADSYEHATVTIYDENGTQLGSVKVRVADTRQKRYTGLSATENLPEDEGMLFTYDSPANHTYVMRKMDFGLDIIYIGADGHITEIHHAPEPPEEADGNDYRYPGYGQYVLEVNLNWTTRHGVDEGDRVVIEGLSDE